MIEDVPGYRILEKVGEGGFSVVYRAYQERLDRQVALKVLSVGAVGAVAMNRFQHECRITGRLTGHPNVVTVLETGWTGAGRPYVAMEYFEQGSLLDRLRREGPLPVPDVLRIGVKMAGALAATHENGVLHRDVKPQNILVSRYGEPALTDFGIALLIGSPDEGHSPAFTPHHAAPEVLAGGPPGVPADLYSLGSTLYQLLAGLPAFQGPPGEDLAAFTRRVLQESPPPIPRPDVPAPVREAIGTAMAKAPERRFTSAVAMARRLQQVQGELGLPVTDLAHSPVEVTELGPLPGDRPSSPLPQVAAPPPAAVRLSPASAPRLSPQELEELVFHQNDEPAGGPAPDAAATGPMAVAGEQAARDNGRQEAEPAAGPPQRRQKTAGARPAEEPEYRPSRRVAAGTVILVGGMVGGIVTAGAMSDNGTSARAGRAAVAPRTGTPTAQPRPNRSAPVTQAQVRAAAPRRLQLVSDRRTWVRLRWSLPEPSRRLPIVVLPSPRDGRRMISAGRGATGVRVDRLRPGTGYCFRVGAMLRTASAGGGRALVAWSEPLCIRTVRPQNT